MKKFIYTILFAFVVSASISSCTDENIKPQDGEGDKPKCTHGCL